MIAATIYDYAGRTVDYLAFDGANADKEALLTPGLLLPGQSGALTTGIQKLVQRFLLELLTEKGSLQYTPDRGTTFMTQLRLGYIRTTAQLIALFNTVELDIRNNLRLEEDFETDPADERFKQAELLSASLAGDRAYLSIKILSQAGTSRTVVYPLRITAI